MDVRLGDASRRRPDGRAGPDRGAASCCASAAARAAVSYDVIVAGGGHNGLVCAAYLARAGRRVAVLERRGAVGRHRSRRRARPPAGCRPPSIDELELRRHGLELIAPGRRAWSRCGETPRRSRSGRDADRTAAGARAPISPADADAYPRFDAHVRELAGFLGRGRRRHAAAARRRRDRRRGGGPAARPRLPAPRRPRRPRAHPGAADGGRPTSSASGSRPTPCAAALAARGTLFTAMGPWSAGTALRAPRRLRRKRRRRRRPDDVRPRRAGGADRGARAAAPAAGAEVRTGAEVARHARARRAGHGRRPRVGREIEAPWWRAPSTQDGAHALARPRGGRPAAAAGAPGTSARPGATAVVELTSDSAPEFTGVDDPGGSPGGSSRTGNRSPRAGLRRLEVRHAERAAVSRSTSLLRTTRALLRPRPVGAARGGPRPGGRAGSWRSSSATRPV